MGRILDWLLGKPRRESVARTKSRAALVKAPPSRTELEERVRRQVGSPPVTAPPPLPHPRTTPAGRQLDEAVARDIVKAWLREEDPPATPPPPGARSTGAPTSKR